MVNGQGKEFISRLKENESQMQSHLNGNQSRRTSPECRMASGRAGHKDPNPHLSPSRILGPRAFRTEDDGCVANTGSFPKHTNAGKNDHLARRKIFTWWAYSYKL